MSKIEELSKYKDSDNFDSEERKIIEDIRKKFNSAFKDNREDDINGLKDDINKLIPDDICNKFQSSTNENQNNPKLYTEPDTNSHNPKIPPESNTDLHNPKITSGEIDDSNNSHNSQMPSSQGNGNNVNGNNVGNENNVNGNNVGNENNVNGNINDAIDQSGQGYDQDKYIEESSENRGNPPKLKRDNNQNPSQKKSDLNEILNTIENSGNTNSKYQESEIPGLIKTKINLLQCNGSVGDISTGDKPAKNSTNGNNKTNYLKITIVGGCIGAAVLLIALILFLVKRSHKKGKKRDVENQYYLPDEEITITSLKPNSQIPNNVKSNQSSNSSPPLASNQSPEIRTRDINVLEENVVNRNISLNSVNNSNMSPPLVYNTINSNNLAFNKSSSSLNNDAIPNINNVNNVPVMPLQSPVNTVNNVSSPAMSSPTNSATLPNDGQPVVSPVLPPALPAGNTTNNNVPPMAGGSLPSYVESVAQKVQPNEHVFVAQYYYNPTFNDEFQISPGDIISFGQSTYDDGWAHGSNLTKDTTGVFPLGVIIKIVDVEGKNRDPYQVSEKYRCKPRSSSHTVKFQASTSEKDPMFEKNSLELNFLLGKLNVEEYLYLNSIERKNIEMKNNMNNNNGNVNNNSNINIIKENINNNESGSSNNDAGASGSSSNYDAAGASGSSNDNDAGASGSSNNNEAGASGSSSSNNA